MRSGYGFRIHMLLIAILLSGCWDMTEVEDLSFIVGIGVDMEKNEDILVTVQIVAPQGSSQQQEKQESSSVNLTSRGKNIQEAMQGFYSKSPRQLFFGHTAVVVFGKRYAETRLWEAIDYFSRNRDFRRAQLLCVTSKTAREVLQATTNVEQNTAQGIKKLIDLQTRTSISFRSNELVTLRQFLSPSRTSLTPWIEVNPKKEAVHKGVGVLKDGRLKILLTNQDARGLMWFLGRVDRAQLTFPCGNGSKSDEGLVNLLNGQTKLEPRIINGMPYIHVKLEGQGMIKKLCSEMDVTPQTIRELEKKTTMVVRQDMERILTKLKRQKLDAVQFANRFFEYDPQWWRKHEEEWEELFPKVRVTYDIRIEHLTTGMLSDSPFQNFSPKSKPPKHRLEE